MRRAVTAIFFERGLRLTQSSAPLVLASAAGAKTALHRLRRAPESRCYRARGQRRRSSEDAANKQKHVATAAAAEATAAAAAAAGAAGAARMEIYTNVNMQMEVHKVHHHYCTIKIAPRITKKIP